MNEGGLAKVASIFASEKSMMGFILSIFFFFYLKVQRWFVGKTKATRFLLDRKMTGKTCPAGGRPRFLPPYNPWNTHILPLLAHYPA